METYYPPIDHAVPDVSGLSWPLPFPRPQPIKINGVLLVGDKSSEELGLASAEDMKQVQQEVSGMGEQITRAVEAATAAEQAAREATEAAQGASQAAQSATQAAQSATQAAEGAQQTAQDATDAAQTATQTANEAKEAAEGKADADDLRYALVTAAVSTQYAVPDEWFPITFEADGTAYSVPLADRDMIVVNMGYLEYHGPNGEFVSMAYFTDGVLSAIAPNVSSSLQFNGVAPVVGETALDATTTATLADRAVNLIAVESGMPSIVLILPTAVEGHSRNLYVRIDMVHWSGGDVPIVTFRSGDASLALTETKGGTWPALVAGNDNIISLKEVAAGVFTVEAAAYERISPPTP